jgi:hypothetical protein
MKNYFKPITLVALALVSIVSAGSAQESFVGKWKTEFESQIGTQKYTFEFKLEDGKLAGKAIGVRDTGTNEVKITELKVDKDEITFVEPLTLQDNEMRIEYKGKLKDDEIKLHRKVGDFAEYDIVAKRIKADAPAAASPGTNAPAAKP